MRIKKIVCAPTLILFAALLAGTGSADAQWTNLTHAFPGYPETCLVLTDGTVMCHEYGTNRWHRLVPDVNGSYSNGVWDPPGLTIANMPNGTDATKIFSSGATCSPCTYAPTYFASEVLADGRVVVIGGEYNTNGNTWTYIGFLYNPATNSWSAQLSEPWGTTTLINHDIVGEIGDSQSVVLQNGTMLIANVFTNDIASFNPGTLTFSSLSPTGKNPLDSSNDEEAWTILPNGKILSVDAGTSNSFEIYDPVANTWGNYGNTAGVNLSDVGPGSTCMSEELGPAVARPDGTVINFTGNTAGQNAVYSIAGGTWSHPAGVDFPVIGGQRYGVPDGPASLLPDGHVLVQASPDVCSGSPLSIFHSPSHFFEWDGTNLTQVSDSANAGSYDSYQGRMLLLPTGEVLFTAYNQGSTSTVQLYSNGGGPLSAWRPVITTAPSIVSPGVSFPISGQQFNGFSQGATYGDDAQMATNYPLVRIVNNTTNHVFYAKTHGHSRMGIEAVGDTSIQSTTFDVPTTIELGASQLYVVTNGIPSLPMAVTVGALPPTISKAFAVPSIPLGGSTSLSFTIANPNAAGTLVGIGFTDPLPAGLAAGSLTGSCGGGTITVSPTTITLTGAALAAGASCTFSVTVTGIAPGVMNNTTSAVTSSAGNGNTASATLDVVAPPMITKSFLPNKFIPGGTTTVSFSITNPNSFAGLTGVAFTDTLPSGLVVATPNGLSSNCGGTATATAGSGTISLSGGTIVASGSCTVTATVTAPEGIYLNSVQVTSTNGGTGNTSSATVYVATPPNLSKAFGELSIGSPASTTLTFTLMNPNHIVTLHALQFSDTLPAGLVISTPDGLTGSCGGGTITAPAGSNLITLTGATLAPQASCAFTVSVTSNGTVLGSLINNTSTVTSTEALPGAAASATIFIGNPLQITYAANPTAGETPVNITNNGAQAAGNICVSLYTLLPSAQMVSCCSCQVTPDALVTLGVNKDLTNNAVQTSVVIKLVATTPGGTCANSAGTQGSLANGAVAYATTLQPVGLTNTYNAVYQPFVGSTLSAAEYAQLTGTCSAKFGGGTFCSSCNPTARP